jgi:photosystem II stability/assembly factor-like uncharacterized protein
VDVEKLTPIAHATTKVLGLMNRVTCPSAEVCWATGQEWESPTGPVDSLLLRSTDGGDLWAPQKLPAGVSGAGAVACPTADRCYVLAAEGGQPVIASTSDGGASWDVNPVGAAGTGLTSITCPAATDCVATGSGSNLTAVIARTVNGSTWTILDIPHNNGIAAGNVSCPTTKACFAVGRVVEGLVIGGGVWRSTDLGLHWATMAEPNGSFDVPRAITCRSGTECELVGGDNTSGVPVVPYFSAASTTDGAGSWHSQVP